MKFNSIHALPFVFSLFPVAANAEAPEFAEVDQDRDGVLSIAEARAALPNVEIRDENGDGVVNYAEIKKAVEGLDLPRPERPNDEATATVGANEYRLIVQTMERNGQDA